MHLIQDQQLMMKYKENYKPLTFVCDHVHIMQVQPARRILKGHLRALPTEIISPAKWRSNRKWQPTNGPADRLATKFPKISGFWWVLQWAAATTGPGNMSWPSSFSPQHRNLWHRSFSFFFVFSEVDGWLAAKVDQYPAYGDLWYFAERGKLLPWCRSDNMLDNGGWRDDAPISSPSSSIWISCAVKASDRTN